MQQDLISVDQLRYAIDTGAFPAEVLELQLTREQFTTHVAYAAMALARIRPPVYRDAASGFDIMHKAQPAIQAVIGNQPK